MVRFFAPLLICSLAAAQTPDTSAKPAPPQTPAQEDKKPITTRHSITAGGRTLNYTATVGMMPIKTSESGEVEAHMFYIAYALEQPKSAAPRPLTFSFNGGPGSASVWLHMGAIGPKRVRMNDDGSLPPPPYQLVDNEATWLDLTDLVFIDPVGTGFSRAVKPDLGKKFFGLEGDIASVGEFIRLYLSRNQRWSSPLFLAGESYGTTRAAGLSGYLIDRGIALNGIALLSTVLNFQTIRFGTGNDLPYVLILPTYTATAWYHKKLPPELQKDLKEALRQAEDFAMNGYTDALAKGDRIAAAERRAAIDKLSYLTGLSKTYVDQSDLRVEIRHFIKELLRDRGLVAGRLDSRITGADRPGASEVSEDDPSLTAIRPPYTTLFNQYIRSDLGYQTDATYYVLGGGIGPWDWGRAQNAYADTSDALRSAFTKNPYMKLFVGFGYFDLATPYFAAQYTLTHSGFPAGTQKNITERYYHAGHMFYINVESLRQLKRDVEAFYAGALSRTSTTTQEASRTKAD
jgi:carboxypeptidase C (cathepsin A)